MLIYVMQPAAEIFRLLAEPARCRLVERLACEGELSVARLTAGSGISQPAVSQHLGALKSGGLVQGRPVGRSTLYSIRPEGFAPIDAWMRRYTDFRNSRLDALETYLDREDQA